MKGLGVSPGKAKGRVKIIKDRSDYEKFKEGDILVTRLTDPTMVSMMGKASAIICEIGGMTSHPSIISRELGIPCIVAVKDATSLLKDEEEIELCGKKGEIKRLQKGWNLRWR